MLISRCCKAAVECEFDTSKVKSEKFCQRCNKERSGMIPIEIYISDLCAIKLSLCNKCIGHLLTQHVDDMDFDTRKAYIHYITSGAISPA